MMEVTEKIALDILWQKVALDILGEKVDLDILGETDMEKVTMIENMFFYYHVELLEPDLVVAVVFIFKG